MYLGNRPPANALSSSGIWTPPQVAERKYANQWPSDADPHWSSVVMLLQPNATDTAITDKSSVASAITINGTVPLSGVSPWQGGASIALVSAGSNWLFVGPVGNSSLIFSSGQAFTIEDVVMMNGSRSGYGLQIDTGFWSGSGTGGSVAYWMGTNNTKLRTDINSGSPANITGTDDFPPFTFVHRAVTHDGTTVRLFLNGRLQASSAASGSYAANLATDYRWKLQSTDLMHVAAHRVTRGVCRYNAAFTPPTGPFPTR